jgi:hypothetical protein
LGPMDTSIERQPASEDEFDKVKRSIKAEELQGKKK